ncbi:MAG: hypothetical protein H2172_01660 [Opitutus sp.]|nr:hypothetical protein [Opitutus sp.]
MKMITADLVVDETKRDTKGRRITPKQRREELLNEYEQSGLTQAAFARRAGVNYPTFASWVQGRRERTAVPLRQRDPIRTQQQVRFAEVNLPASTQRALSSDADSLSVTLPDGLVVRGADAVALAELVKALRG